MRLRARTIRMRLTLIYGSVFLVSSAALLTVGFLLVRHNLDHHHSFRSEVVGLGAALYHQLFGRPLGQPAPNIRAFQAGYHQAVDAALHRLLFEYVGALVVMTGVSVALGWWIAGRALAPLRAITATAQRVSGENLGERISLQGPDDELKELADTFDGMLMRLDSAFASQKHFVANASHEMRTPLAIMRTEVDVALADPHASVAELRAMGEGVRETIDRKEQVDLAELAGDCITDLHRNAEAAGITIVTSLGPAAARGDSALLERMLANLVENGIRHNRPGGELSVATSTAGGMAEVTVCNGGAVIPSADVQSLTEPFRRLSRTAGGVGLGLSIVRSVAEVHGGTLELLAPPAGGLQVRVRVPADLIGGGQGRRQRSLTKS
jgi:signal transduction histidine kinase